MRLAARSSAFAVLFIASCMVGDSTPQGDDDDDDQGSPDASIGGGPDAAPAACSMPASTPDLGAMTAVAQQKNQPGTMGARKYYIANAMLPGSDEVVQIELWDNLGAFAGRTVAPGTYPITGAELAYSTCGVCVRGAGNTGAVAQQYLATAGSVQVIAVGPVGQPLTVQFTGVTLGQVNTTNGMPIADGCSAAIAGGRLSGTLVNADGNGGGGGGGGGNGGGGGGGGNGGGG